MILTELKGISPGSLGKFTERQRCISCRVVVVSSLTAAEGLIHVQRYGGASKGKWDRGGILGQHTGRDEALDHARRAQALLRDITRKSGVEFIPCKNDMRLSRSAPCYTVAVLRISRQPPTVIAIDGEPINETNSEE